MGPTEVPNPTPSSEIIKIPTANYDFGAGFIDPKVCCLLIVFCGTINGFHQQDITFTNF